MIKHKIEVHTAFNLITPEGLTDHSFKPFPTGTHTVTEAEAEHPWVQQHSNYIGEVEIEDEEEVEAEEAPRGKKRK